jgi:hypothetical protein
MPVEFSIDKEDNIVYRTLRGEVRVDEVLASLEETAKHPDYRPGMKSLNDVREYTPRSTSSDVRQIAEYLLGHADVRKGLVAAVVVSQAVSYGMTRMLQALADNPDFSISVFYDLEEAKRWLEAVRPGVGDLDLGKTITRPCA